MSAGNRESCSCEWCTSACQHKPGWFMPGQVTEAAALLGMEPQEFFDKYLAVDWYDRFDADVFVLAPATLGYEGGMYPANPKGTCVFFQGGACAIHAAKPYECAQSLHSDSRKSCQTRHGAVAAAWTEAQDEVTALYPYPVAAEYGLLESFLW